MPSTVELAYDPLRGGFEINFGPWHRSECVGTPICENWLTVWVSKKEPLHIQAVESFWYPGGLPLRHLFGGEYEWPNGVYALEADASKVGPIQIRQNARYLDIWFSSGGSLPRPHWNAVAVPDFHMTMWFSSQKIDVSNPTAVIDESSNLSWVFKPKADPSLKVPASKEREAVPFVAGIRLSTQRLPVAVPIAEFELTPEDFK